MAFADDEGRRTPSAFSPTPEKSRWPAWLLVLLILLGTAAWYWHEHPGLAVTVRTPARSTAAVPGAATAASAPAVSRTSPPPVETFDQTPYAAPAQTVSKCMLKGRITYSDGPCPDGAKAEQLAVRPDVNLMQAPVLAQAGPGRSAVPAAAPAPVVVQAPQPHPSQAITCPGLARYIEELDAWARQPQSGQMQDWITARKREVRDQQFRLKC